jgi:deazaflavin-dependent oxidoreductase (nitroreductase family)
MTDETSPGPELVRWGRAARLETTGRRSGRAVTSIVSFHEEAGGSLLISAGDPDADWARNLVADPAVIVTIADRSFPAVAEVLNPDDHAVAVRELILKGGTPAERLGRGPSFRLRRVVQDA